MFGHIFYFFGLILVLLDLGLLMKFHKIQNIKNWIQSFVKVAQKKPKKEDMDREDYKIVTSYDTLIITNFLWIFFGLISKSWKLFLLVLLINFFLNFLLHKTKSYRTTNYLLEFVRFIIIITCVSMTTINHFHLHIDLYNFIINSFVLGE